MNKSPWGVTSHMMTVPIMFNVETKIFGYDDIPDRDFISMVDVTVVIILRIIPKRVELRMEYLEEIIIWGMNIPGVYNNVTAPVVSLVLSL